MKVLFVDESINRIGGVERVISTLANRLSFNNEVEVVSVYKSTNSPFYNYNENIKISYLIDSRKYKTNKLKSKNLKYYFFRIFEKLKDKVILNKRINKIILNFNDYDVIIFGRVFTAIDFLCRFKNSVKAKIIVRDAIHLEYYSNEIKNKMKALFPKYVNKFIVSSDESINAYKQFFCDNNELEIVKIYNPLGIMPKVGYKFSNKTIISIGRLDDQKGYDNLIKAFALISNKYNDWKLKIYGNGNYAKYLEKLVSSHKLEDQVEILPSVKDVVKIFNESSIFVLPSRYEGYANVLVEAMACGIPSISYDWFMGVEEIINNNINGFIVKLKNRKDYFNGISCNEDIENLAKKIEYVINNPVVCSKISTNACKIVDTRNIEYILNKWINLIN